MEHGGGHDLINLCLQEMYSIFFRKESEADEKKKSEKRKEIKTSLAYMRA